ncbi:hypothetical protein [Chitinophaga ginsengisoli]|uniref:Uncharacterized protein n=1 Tax=Chitinophaga ginsengisoli TaxID=363837 RepID=A0A2P8FXH9_9BACT|nr:hypothetical protein [Chitinophaga ginsengisoli]PSL26424.1 hypothetical protein CLV42_111136 [Chitinophaga ginsengisoli]
MKKYLLLSTIVAFIGFYSCTKNGDNVKRSSPDSLARINPDVLTAGIKVAYGTNIVNAVFPTTSNLSSAPVLDTPFTKIYGVFKGGYLTIIPHNLSGNVAGYYVQIAGAASYFKVDYTKASGFRRAGVDDRNTARGLGTGFIDSAIVIKLPASIESGTFHLIYAAYDTLNHVSNVTTVQVIVLDGENNAVNDSLVGTWRYLYGSCNPDEKLPCSWSPDTGYRVSYYYECVNGLLVHNNTSTAMAIPYEVGHFDDRITFRKDGFTADYKEYVKVLNVENSTCSNYVYDYENSDNDTTLTIGALSFDAASRKLTLIFKSHSSVGLTYKTFTLAELTDSSFTFLYGSRALKYIRL